jgi:hypothetical protein
MKAGNTGDSDEAAMTAYLRLWRSACSPIDRSSMWGSCNVLRPGKAGGRVFNTTSATVWGKQIPYG